MGQITDADGRPAAGVRVFVVASAGDTPATGVQALSSIGETDAAGRYRLEGIPPGSYVVAAGFIDTPTYYPGVKSLAAARPIVMALGQAVAGIDFKLSQTGVRVSGRVTGLQNGIPPGMIRASLMVFSRETTLRSAGPLDVEVQADGSFEFLRIPPGRYSLRFLHTTVTAFEVHDEDIGPLNLTIGPALLGRMVIEGGGTLPMPMNAPPGIPNLPPLVGLQASRTNVSSPASATVPRMRSDGTFLWLLPAGEYSIAVTFLPIGLSLKSVSSGGVNLLQTPGSAFPPVLPLKLDGTAPPAEVVVTLTESAGARVTGRVTDLPGAPASNEFWVRLQTYVDTSVVFSDPDGVPYPTSVRHIGEAKVASDGTFEFVRVPPGTYTAQVFPRGGPNIDSMTTRVVVRDVDVSGVQLKPFDRAWPEATRLPAPSVDPEVRPAALQARLQSLGGPTAKDCGHASLAQLRAGPGMQVIRCVEDAVERKTAFIASLQQQWFDTIVMVGIAAPQSGAVSVFDSYGDGMSAPRHCARPKFPTASGGLVGLLRCD